ncbi:MULTISPECIES: glycerophosphodiester phosphodiesterase [Thermus]|uniref:Glycerophosphodiester phosphodiesterase n=2 Tax=Thermus TaxID=270 RepID=A0A430R9K9_THESC|nr:MULTISPECIES: glycerophosphodiester phosphodiesterase [Thermus]QWK22654.1 MAG: glycerophosphodiester phosphodiesterase [Thermus antranikianii]RTH04067.1 glycerophosphodiester phosphodiesterase [Thermus scotoductus]WCM38692.1 glycerophosphodiester phosphodiesterase [Thermus antranikianii]
MPLRLGHRGAPRLVEGEAQAYVENTLEAFRQALEAGLDGFELDVHLTRDGVLVVHHDFTLGGIPINGVSSRELPAYVPTLEEVLRTFPGAWINVELKSLPPETDGREEALARLLARYPSDRIWVSSFDPLALVRLRRLGVGPLGLLYQHEEAEALAPCLGVEWVHPEASLLTEAKVRELRGRYRVLAWTVNRRQQAQELAAWGVDALVTDFPGVLV